LAELPTLPDYLKEGLDIVLVGLNPSLYSARVGHYFANPRNRFWAALDRSGLVDTGVGERQASLIHWTPEQDYRLLEYHIGFTDVVKRPTPQASGLTAADFRQWVPVLKAKLLQYQPHIVCFHGMVAYKAYLQYAEGAKEKSTLGLQGRTIGNSRIFVVPNPSPANAQFSLDDLVYWYRQLKALREELNH
jgi:TDG/mug DNA glycosylase family protein